MPPVLLRAGGALALAGAAVMMIAAAGGRHAEAPPQAALFVTEHDQDAEAAASRDSARLVSPAEPSQAVALLPSPADPGPWQPAAADAAAPTGGEASPDAAAGGASVDPALRAAAVKEASKLTGAVRDRTSAPAETAQAEEPVPVDEASRLGEASPGADPPLEQAYAPAEAASGEAAEMTSLLVAPPIPEARPEPPPVQRQAARKSKSTRATRAGSPSEPAPNCGKKRARWRYVNDVPTWYCR